MNIIQWCVENWDKVLAVLGAFYAFATAIAAITPSDKDNTLIDKVGAFFDRVGIKFKGK
jgi:hypothetical protein